MPECERALDPYEPAGVRQFTSLMLALCTPEKRDPCSPLDKCTQPIALRTFHMGAVSWKVFSETWPAQQALYQNAMANVTNLKLLLDVGRKKAVHRPRGCIRRVSSVKEANDCRRFFKDTGALRTFLMAAPKLEKLHVEFDINDWLRGLGLCDLVGDGEFTWKALREVNSAINMQEEELIAFLTRHKKTLKRLIMGRGLTLIRPGASFPASAATLLSRMRDAVEWEEISVGKWLGIVRSALPRHDFIDLGQAVNELKTVESGPRVQDFLMRRSDVNPFGIEP